jgi:hypothetical protein
MSSFMSSFIILIAVLAGVAVVVALLGVASWLIGGGGGSRKVSGLFSYPHTPSKNRARFHEYKYTSLIFLVGGFSVNRLPLG